MMIKKRKLNLTEQAEKVLNENIIQKFLDVLVNWDAKKVLSDPKFKKLKHNAKKIDDINKEISDLQPEIKKLQNFLRGDGPHGDESNLDYIYDYIKN